MSKFWLVVLKNGLQVIVNALTDRDAKDHVKREQGLDNDNDIDDCCEWNNSAQIESVDQVEQIADTAVKLNDLLKPKE